MQPLQGFMHPLKSILRDIFRVNSQLRIFFKRRWLYKIIYCRGIIKIHVPNIYLKFLMYDENVPNCFLDCAEFFLLKFFLIFCPYVLLQFGKFLPQKFHIMSNLVPRYDLLVFLFYVFGRCSRPSFRHSKQGAARPSCQSQLRCSSINDMNRKSAKSHYEE